jgi:hypothetical protein
MMDNDNRLGTTVAYRYALAHPQYNHDQFIPIHVTNKGNIPFTLSYLFFCMLTIS